MQKTLIVPNIFKRAVVSIDPLEHLNAIPLFEGLSEAQSIWMRQRMHAHTFPPGVDIITAGAQGETIYIVLSGTVKVYMINLDGSEVTLSLLGPGDPVGEMSMVDGSDRSASVITLEETTLLWMNREDFNAALNTIPRLAQNLLRVIAKRLRDSSDNVRALASLNVNGRIARQLLAFAERYGQRSTENAILLPVRLTQGDLSELVGASRKRVNQMIGALKRARIIEIDEALHITICDKKELLRWAEEG